MEFILSHLIDGIGIAIAIMGCLLTLVAVVGLVVFVSALIYCLKQWINDPERKDRSK